jgi:hypothetical protein
MSGINYLAVGAAALSSFVIGGVWYSVLFADPWMEAAKVRPEDLKAQNKAMVFGGAFVLALAGAFVFAMFLGPRPEFGFATGAGFAAGLAWVAGSFGINYLFEGRPFKLWAINGGYHVVQYTAIGAILGLWH